jgi:hypothetical protein
VIVKLAPKQGCQGGFGDGQDCSMPDIMTLVSFVGFSIIIFLNKIILVMQGARTPHNFILDGKESFVEEVSETICLSYEIKIVQRIFYSKFSIQTFLLMI